MTQLYAGNPASYPTNITLPSDDSSDTPQAPLFNAAYEGLADRTAYLFANYLPIAGGTVTGNVTFQGGVTLENTLVLTSGASIQSTIADGIQSTVLDGIVSLAAGGIGSYVPAGIVSRVVAGITNSVDGGFQLGGTAADWIRYGTTRSKSIVVPFNQRDPLGTGWTSISGIGSAIFGPATTAPTRITLNEFLFDGSRNGATLNGITLRFDVAVHANVPATPPSVNIWRVSNAPGSFTHVSLFSTGAQPLWPVTAFGGMAMPGSGAAWQDTGLIQTVSFAPDQNNVIDLSSYTYVLEIIDESGVDSVAGNGYLIAIVQQNAIANNAF